VSGAITLLHDRWPWLARHPHETVDIILRSAKDLGAPGTDSVYGRGMLDVAASQSPLDFWKLTFTEVRNGVATPRTASEVRNTGVRTTWEAEGAYFTLIEKVGATHRDFQVPMSTRLVGQKTAVNGTPEYFQTYIRSRLTGWIKGSNSFTDVATQVMQPPGAWSFAATTGAPEPVFGRRDLAASPHVSFRMADPTGRLAFSAGHGQGAMVLRALPAFSMTRDYSSADGGVNPMLGLASGGAFASAEFALSPSTVLSVGATQRTLVHARNPALDDVQRDALRNVEDYEAGAFDLRLTHRLSGRVSLTAGYANLRESNALLGVQSTEPGDFAHGSRSHVADVGASFALPAGLTVSASATLASSRTAGGDDQALTSAGEVVSSAYAVAMTKEGLLGPSDLLRFSLSQPLHIVKGKLGFTAFEVIDRQTGELGFVNRTFEIRNARRHVAETLYAAPVLEGQGQVSLFGRAELQNGEADPDLMVGAGFNVRF
jgi:hypothetical protein